LNIEDFEGTTIIEDEILLENRIRSVRNGEFGAFSLFHETPYPWLSIHINGNMAYIHYVHKPNYAGFQPTEMTPKECKSNVFFLQITGIVADGFEMANEVLVSLDDAVIVAKEFFNHKNRPIFIKWVEL